MLSEIFELPSSGRVSADIKSTAEAFLCRVHSPTVRIVGKHHYNHWNDRVRRWVEPDPINKEAIKINAPSFNNVTQRRNHP